MEYCDDCGSALVPNGEQWECMKCGFVREREVDKQSITAGGSTDTAEGDRRGSTALERLDATDSGNIKKADAMSWLESLDRPSDTELKDAIVPKPNGHTGSTFPTEISTIRVTGDPNFIETVAGLFKSVPDMEDYRHYVEINLKQVADRDTDEVTDNWALYLSVSERSG